MRSAQPMMGLPFYRHIPKTTSERAGVWYPPNPSPSREAYGASVLEREPIMPGSQGTTATGNPPTWLAVFWVVLYLLYLSHDSAHPDQPEGGLTTRPLSPKMLLPPPKGLAGMVWDGLGLGKCILHFWPTAYNCSILHIVVGYICATYWNSYVHYTTYVYVDAWGGGEEGCCTRITVYYIGR